MRDFFLAVIATPIIWLSIITINMTVIGLTSLAERKSIIGVDYTRFLFSKYRLFGRVPMIVVLLSFAVVNAVSIYVMMIDNHLVIIKAITFILLLICLSFIIYYFFSFILIENKNVRHQIIQQEILGLYFDIEYSIESKNPWLDLVESGPLAEKNKSKSLSTNVIAYFDTYSIETCESFDDCFGPRSILYPKNDDEEIKLKEYYKKVFNRVPPNYTRKHIQDDCTRRTFYISREFYDFLQYTKQPVRWLYKITELMYDYNHRNGDEGVWNRFDIQLSFSNMTVVMRFLADDSYAFDNHLLSLDFADRFFRYIGESWCINEKGLYKSDNYFDRNDICPQKEIKEYTFAFYLASFVYKMLSNKYISFVSEEVVNYYKYIISDMYSSSFPFSGNDCHTSVKPRIKACIEALEESYSSLASDLLKDIIRCYIISERGKYKKIIKSCKNQYSANLVLKYIKTLNHESNNQ